MTDVSIPDLLARTKEALADPKPGDVYQEMYSYWHVVVAVSDWGITVLRGGGPINLVAGRIRPDRRKRSDPEWVPIAPWQERAEEVHYATVAEFQRSVGGDLLNKRGLDISGWAAQRADARAAAEGASTNG